MLLQDYHICCLNIFLMACTEFNCFLNFGGVPLNAYNQLEPWQPVIFQYMGT